jgi:hypothetical protein
MELLLVIVILLLLFGGFRFQPSLRARRSYRPNPAGSR